MNFITISELNNTICKHLSDFPEDIDLIVGIPRSGLLVANLIALHKNLPFTDIDSFLNDEIFDVGKTKNTKNMIFRPSEARKIIVIDDSSISGNSIFETRKKINNSRYHQQIQYWAVYVTNQSSSFVDNYMEVINPPRVFEWNLMQNNILNSTCMDIDGVLCPDPTETQNDDGEKYIDFILNTNLRIQPGVKIHSLVTSRLEKYRTYTEDWLKKHHIEYDNLEMMQYKTKEERISCNNYGEYKANIYKLDKKAQLFIESDEGQAITIANQTLKPVYCTSTQKYYHGSSFYEFHHDFKYKSMLFLKRITPKTIKNNLKNLVKK